MTGENQTTAREWRGDIVDELYARQHGGLDAAAAGEIVHLRALVTRLTNVADNLASELTDPGTEALAAIYCGRNFIYG